MLRVTLRGLLARKMRLTLSALAIVLGVAFVSGTFVLTDTLGRVFDDLFATVGKGVAVQVQGVQAFTDSGVQSGNSSQERRPVTDAVLTQVRAVPGVAAAVGAVDGYAQLVRSDGKVIGNGQAPSLGQSWDPVPALNPLTLRTGRAPERAGEIAIDAATARSAGLSVGDRLTVLVKGPVQQVVLVGVFGFGDTDNLAGATLTAFDVRTAQQLLMAPGQYRELRVAAAPGVTEEVLRQRVAAALPTGYEARTGVQAAAAASNDIKTGLSFFNTALLVFAAIALFVGAFLIVNTFTMLVAQRTRELALLRALGASRGQVLRSVVAEAVAVGLIASVLGFGLGVLVAIGLRALLGVLGIDLPAGPLVVAPRTAVVALVVGVAVTTLASVVPARRASVVPPVAALRESGPAEPASLRRRAAMGAVVLGIGIAALTYGLSAGRLPLVGLGALLVFVGVAVLSPLAARPVTRALGAPLVRVGGVAAKLGTGNATRNPRRTSATAAALMVGLALVSAVAVLGASLKASVGRVVEESFAADYLLSTSNFQPFSPQVGAAIAGKPGIAAVAVFTFGRAQIDGSVSSVQGVEGTALQAAYKLDVRSGDELSIDRGDLLLSVSAADAKGLEVGDVVPVVFALTGPQAIRVGGTYATNQFAGDYLIGARTYARNFAEELAGAIAVKTDPGADPVATRAVIDSAVRDFPSVRVQSREEFVAAQKKQLAQLLNAIYALLVLSVLIALLGVVNTLALSVLERTRELGLLRAVGLDRRRMKRMIRIEAVVISVYGALLGLVVGTALGWALVRALRDQGVQDFSLPVGTLVAVVVVAALAGVLAAALPARRAARLDILRAIATV